MPSVTAVTDFLTAESVPYALLEAEEVSPLEAKRWLRAALFRDQRGHVLVVLPCDEFLDSDALNKATGRILRPVFAEDYAEFAAPFGDAPLVPLGGLYKTTTVLQHDVPADGRVGIIDAQGQMRLIIEAKSFRQLQHDTTYAPIAFTVTPELIEHRYKFHAFARKRLEGLLADVEGLPAMPEMSQRILQITGDPDSDALDLARAIEMDPSLAAQVISYATSAFYGYRGEIATVRDAISRVLGFELVANIALGISIGTRFHVPADGPIGLSAFWRHAVYSAALCERITKIIPRDRKVSGGRAYLGALLHDFGLLVLGHLAPPAFEALNDAMAANPSLPITQLEALVLGVRHADLGVQLLQQWKIPDEAVIAAQHHHSTEYRDDYAAYPHLVNVVERLLHRHHVVSDADPGPVPQLSWTILGVTESAVEAAALPVINACSELDTLATLLGKSA